MDEITTVDISAVKELNQQIAETINEALEIDVSKKHERKKGDDICYSLVSTVNEFLDAFIIIGFDTSGDPHMLKYANTIQSQEALMSMLSKFYAHEASNGISVS
jgi:hypothetical protein